MIIRANTGVPDAAIPHVGCSSLHEQNTAKKNAFQLRKAADERGDASRCHLRNCVHVLLEEFFVHFSRSPEEAQDVDLLRVREAPGRGNVHLGRLGDVERLDVLRRLYRHVLAHQQRRPNVGVRHKVQHVAPNRCRQMRRLICIFCRHCCWVAAIVAQLLGLALPRIFRCFAGSGIRCGAGICHGSVLCGCFTAVLLWAYGEYAMELAEKWP